MDSLPEDCVSKILSYTSPPDACRFSMVSSTLHSAADSDLLWKSFCPSDYHRILARVLHPHTLDSSSYKNLFFSLCHPLLLDGGNMVYIHIIMLLFISYKLLTHIFVFLCLQHAELQIREVFRQKILHPIRKKIVDSVEQ